MLLTGTLIKKSFCIIQLLVLHNVQWERYAVFKYDVIILFSAFDKVYLGIGRDSKNNSFRMFNGFMNFNSIAFLSVFKLVVVSAFQHFYGAYLLG